MANLTLDKSSIGYDTEALIKAVEDIKIKVIDDSIKKMNTDFENLKIAVDACWQGNSAEQFKKNMERDKELVQSGLREIRDAIGLELHGIQRGIATVDDNLISSKGGAN